MLFNPLQFAFWHTLLPLSQTSADGIMSFMEKLASILPSITPFANWWDQFCRDTSAWQLELIVTVFVQLIGFWLPATIYQLIDVCFPEFSKAHKHQPDPRRQPTRIQILHCIRYAFFVTLGDVALQIGFGYLTNFRPVFTISPTLPTLKEMMRHFIYGNLAREILAYYVHRCLHHRWFYARHHKLHHSFTTPIAFTGLYTTPVEHFFADIIPIVLPLALIAYYYEPVHILSFNIFLISVLLVGTAEHSGYNFAQPPVSKAHDLHHEKFNVNYGSLHFMDWLHGTDL
ncbi:MAG: sterol desaturase [Lasallia pustulata]|uniref:Sterol desaturase n=1 Tax=Lasallia pustulata TaxID=136370 RepID=A0A5M8PVV6_9LECA|nr:MAG: sterol desaturase [Lasallia pustulata]